MRRIWRKGWKALAITTVIVLIPTAALAVIGTFSSTTTTPAVTGTNSSAAAGSPGVLGSNTGGGLNTRYGVQGTANGTLGVGVSGTGTKYGVFSNGPLGVANGKFLTCVAVTGCVGSGALTASSVTNAKLAAGSVDSSKLAAGAVQASNLGIGSVGTAAIADGSVTSAKLNASVHIPGVSVTSIGGSIGGTSYSGSVWSFVGSQASVTVASGQSVIVDGEFRVGSSAGGPYTSARGCWSSDGGVTVHSFDSNYVDEPPLGAGELRTLHVSDSVNGLSGSLLVGLCVDPFGGGTLNTNDWSGGYVEVIG